MTEIRAFLVRPDGSLSPHDPAGAISIVAQSFRSRNAAVFYGAGLSFAYPALLPMAVSAEGVPGLREVLRQALMARLNFALPPELLAELAGLSLEVILDYFSRYLGPGLLEFYDILRSETYADPPRPNLRHFWLALLGRRSLCNHFLTVNFDLLDVAAFQALGVKVQIPEWEIDPKSEQLAYEFATNSPRAGSARIYKLHGLLNSGDQSNRNLLATVERVGSGLPHYKNRLLEEIVRSHDLLFFGYSDRDIDVFPRIAQTSSVHRFFWFELQESWISPQVLTTLAERQGIVFAGDPDIFLLELSDALGFNKAELLARTGCNSLEDLREQHAVAAINRAAGIVSFKDSYAKKFFPSEIPARLLLGNMIIEARWGFTDLLADLIASLPATRLEPQIEYARQRLLAEYSLTIGRLTEAFHYRRRAISLTREQGFSGTPLQIDPLAAQLEQEAWCFLESARIFRRGQGLSRPWYFFQTLLYSTRARLHLARFAHRLNPSEATTFLAMIKFGWGNIFQTAADALQRGKIRSRRQFNRTFLNASSAALYTVAERIYRRGLSSREMSDHWRFQLMQRIAETLVHLSGYQTSKKNALMEEAHKLLDEAGGFFDWGRTRRRVYMDVHRALEKVYSGDPQQALFILQHVYASYEASGYVAGMTKSTLYMALAYDALGRPVEARKKLDEFDTLRSQQN